MNPPPEHPDPAEPELLNEALALDEEGSIHLTETSPQRRSVAHNVAALLASQVVSWTLALGMTLIVPRFVGPEGLGQLRLGGSLWAISSVFVTFGTTTLITVTIARGEEARQLVRSTMGLQIVLYAISGTAVLAGSLLAGYRGRLLTVILIMSAMPILAGFGSVARAAFFGFERMASPARIDIINKVGGGALVLLVLLLGGRTIAVSVVYQVTLLAYAAHMLLQLRRETGLSIRPSGRGLIPVAKLAAPFLLIEAAVTVYQQVDTVVIASLVNETQVGWYGVADQLIGSLLVIPSLVLTAVFPAMARVSSESDEEARALVERGVRLLAFIGVPMGLGLVVVSEQLARLLWGPAFARSAPVMSILGISLVLMLPAMLLGNYALAVKRQRVWAGVTCLAIVVSIPLNIVLVQFANERFGNGAAGGAAVYVITELLILALTSHLLMPGVFGGHVGVGIVKALLAGLLMLAATWPLRHLLLPIPIAVGVVVYALGITVLRAFDQPERAMLQRAIHRLRSRSHAG